jgi:DNA polymerase elongation subunit (family B)
MITPQPLIIDIETVPHRFNDYHAAFPRSKKKPGIHAIISEVVAIGIVDGQQPSVLSRDCEEVQGFDSEREMLEWVSGVLREHKNDPIIGFNIKNFDLPLLQLRAAKYGIKLDLPDRRSPRIIDIYEILGGKWATDISACSLSELAWFLYGQPKQSSGADVAEMWARDDIAGIKGHCMEDILLTSKIYQDFQGVLW